MTLLRTEDPEYAKRLQRLSGVWWKKLIPVQLPYSMHFRALNLGFVLDIGCGIGRNLAHLKGRGIGIDHNQASVDFCRKSGFQAYLPESFMGSEWARSGQFDAILLSHMLEHIVPEEQEKILTLYLPFLKENGLVAILVPQEAGYRSDPTHVTFMDHEKMEELGHKFSLRRVASYSFPFPRWVGMYFRHNESVMLLRK